MKLFGLDKYNIVQLHVVLLLFGYWLVSAVANLLIGETSQSISIGYRLFQFVVSLYVLFLCKKDVFRKQGHLLPIVCVLGLVFFSIRIIFDIIGGPFAYIVPKSWFVKDFLYNVIGVFFSVFVVFVSRKYIDVNKVVFIAFWFGLITIICVLLNINNMDYSYEEDRMEAGRGLGTLTIVQIGAIELLLSIHLIVNTIKKKIKVFYLFIVCLAVFTMLISGSRGGLVGVVFALGLYLILKYRKNVLMIILIATVVLIIGVNIISILEWLASYFPVISKRLLATILENDQSDREILRELAVYKIIDNPILGYSYRLLPTETGYTTHNGILDILIISGIPIGVLFVYFFYVKSVFLSIKIINNKRYSFPILLLLFVLISSMFGGILYSNMFWVAIALVCSSYYKENKH